LDYEHCPGEIQCSDVGRIRDFRSRDSELPVVAICENCKFRETKPGAEPEHLTQAIITANEMDTIKSGGGVFQYPEALTPFEWACLKALQRGRSESEAHSRKEKAGEKNDDAERARLDAMRRRGNRW
jgi:hypothetical protein